MRAFRVEGGRLRQTGFDTLPEERELEDWIVSDPSVLGLEAIPLCRQANAGLHGRPDLLFLDGEGRLLIVELKRDATPRDVIAQVLEYGAWASNLEQSDIAALHDPTFGGRPLEELFAERFGKPLSAIETIGHELYIVASALDRRTRAIVTYLSTAYDVPINGLFFKTLTMGGERVLIADWLVEDEVVARRKPAARRRSWTGFHYVNVGTDPNEDWEDNRRHGYLGAGGGPKYSDPLRRLATGDLVLAYRKRQGDAGGYVGVGRVAGPVVPPTEFTIESVPIASTGVERHRFFAAKAETADANFVLPVEWLATVPETEGVYRPGLFTNQAIVCRLNDEDTVKYVLQGLGIEDPR